MNPHIFREYDIRGVVDRDLTPDTVRGIGRGFGSAIGEGGGRTVAPLFNSLTTAGEG